MDATEGTEGERQRDRFKFHVEDLIEFLFPPNLQHPLASARLFVFALYGPLDEHGHLRSGRKGAHTIAEYELETMCMQIEREDIVQIYLHRARDMGMLSTAEQDMMINQADAHLKKEKGKASLPRMSKEDVRNLLKHLPRDDRGMISFHDAQRVIDECRRDRVKRYKLVFPNLTSSQATESGTAAGGTGMGTGTQRQGTATMESSAKRTSTLHLTNGSAVRSGLGRTVSTSVAPQTMFQRMKGLTNADLIEQTTKRIGKHGFKITDLDQPSSVAVTSNVRLLRDIPPNFDNPYHGRRASWDNTCNMGGVGMGSMVQGTGGSTTWRRKYTTY